MSEVDKNVLVEVKRSATALLQLIGLVEKLGDLEATTKALESRVASLKKQEADIIDSYNAVRDKAKAEAKAMLDEARQEIGKRHAESDRELQAKIGQAKAVLENFATARRRLEESEIPALNKEAASLREQKEQARQELAFYRDGAATAKADYERVKKQLAELKQAL
jgi:hypothetical protein